jgi:hypothetical protein
MIVPKGIQQFKIENLPPFRHLKLNNENGASALKPQAEGQL